MTIIHALQDGKFEPFRQAPLQTMTELVASIVENSDAAVCDHRLRWGGFADVSGAELAANLIQAGHPTILVTQYLDQDSDVTIRSYRKNLPVVLRREDADEPEELRSAFARCLSELNGGKLVDRVAQKTLLRVTDVRQVDGVGVIDAFVHGWNAKDAVSFPITLVDAALRSQIVRGVTLEALTNIGAEEKADLFFDAIRVVEEPESNDGLQ